MGMALQVPQFTIEMLDDFPDALPVSASRKWTHAVIPGRPRKNDTSPAALQVRTGLFRIAPPGIEPGLS